MGAIVNLTLSTLPLPFPPTETTSDLVGDKIPEKIAKAASKSTHEDPGKLITSAQTDENTYRQKNNNKFLMNMNFRHSYHKNI